MGRLTMGARHCFSAMIAGASAAVLVAACAQARQSEVTTFDLPSQDLGVSLRAVAAKTRLNIAAPSALVSGRQAPALAGAFTGPEAVTLLLKGSGLRAEQAGPTIVVRPAGTNEAGAAPYPEADDLVITGSRIRGAPVASTVITRGAEEIRNLGQSDLGQVVRDIPQSYGGGQNPGVGQAVPAASGSNIGAGSSINLRGLGSDATLTLLNGHRLPYSAQLQSVDVSAIPVAVLDRIEIVPDGASALYGSDAVAGVANIILKRDFRGLALSTLLGTATEGGDSQQLYSALAGNRWRGGGIVAAYEYGRATEISADNRAYGAGHPGLTLYPANRHHSMVASLHQSVDESLSTSVDGFYNVRWSGNFFPTGPATNPGAQRTHFISTDRAYALAPSLEYRTRGSWRVELTGSVGREQVNYSQTACTSSGCTSNGAGHYRNTETSVELNGDGVVARAPGGAVKLALGAGIRHIGFERFNGAGSTLNTDHVQSSYYAFGELSLPIVGQDNASPLLRSLIATAALRYERYPGIGQVATPKLGLIYGASRDVDLRASWGKSFRAPTLYQQWQPRSVYLYPPTIVGGKNYPPTAAVLLVLGGNPDLRPERADTWSAGADIHPDALPGFEIGLSYFSVHYHDRIVTPIQTLSVALTDPNAAGQVILSPSAAAVSIAVAQGLFTNVTGKPFVPGNVVAIVDDSSVNAGRFVARGLDGQARYKTRLGTGELNFASSLAYLISRRQLTILQPVVPLAGRIFNPPHWRAQASATWTVPWITLTAAAHYVGGVYDYRYTPAASERGMTSYDVTARVRPQWTGVLHSLELTLSVQNLLDTKPGLVRTKAAYEQPYDSTNYGPIGRFVSVGVRTSW